eukprot:m.677730 g.677730  ORF g.677730 m.677730 type:complete len:53 (+) comp58573_c0_seq3:186-344(+)
MAEEAELVRARELSCSLLLCPAPRASKLGLCGSSVPVARGIDQCDPRTPVTR